MGTMNRDFCRIVSMESTQNSNCIHATPSKSSGPLTISNETYPNCDDEIKPHPGMMFELLQEGIDFYKQYAHHVGFSVRLSSETKKRE